MLKRGPLIITTLIVSIVCSFSQQYPVVRYTPKDGLINSRVRDAFQDSKGRIYFMTFSGLSVYDGIRFRNYSKQDGLRDDLVNDILEITPDSLLISTNTSGLNALVNGHIRTIPTLGKNNPIVNQFLYTSDGHIYTTTDEGLFELHGHQFEKWSTRVPGIEEPANFLGPILDADDFILIASNDLRMYKGLYLVDKKNKNIISALPDVHITSMVRGPEGMILILANQTLYNLDTAALAKGKLLLNKPNIYAIPAPNQPVGKIAFDHKDNLIVLMGATELMRCRRDGTYTEINSPEISGLAIQQIFVDSENTIWICTDGNGIYKISNTTLRYDIPIAKENPSGIGLVSQNIHDSIFLVTNDYKVVLHTSEKDQAYHHVPAFKFNLVHFNRRDAYAADGTILYFAHIGDPGDYVLHFRPILTEPDSVKFSTRMLIDPYGQFIIGNQNNICVFSGDKLLQKFPINVLDLIEGFLVDSQNRMITIFRSGNILFFSIHPDQPQNYLREETNFPAAESLGSPRSCAIDKQNLIWIGTRYAGVKAFEYTQGQLISRFHYGVQDGLTDNFVTTLAVDSNQNIIVGTQTGIDKLIKTGDSYRIDNITKRNNIFSFIRQCWVDSDNHAFALTNSGKVFEIEPREDKLTSFEPDIYLEAILVNEEALANIPNSLTLSHAQRNVTFSFAAPTFLDESQVMFQYKLDGLGHAVWSKTIHGAEFNFLNLPSGDYRLTAKAIFTSTPYPDKTISFVFTILPAWWQTTIFRVMAILILSAIIFFILQTYYRRKLQTQKLQAEKQQAIEKERTRIATDMHDDLGAGLSRIRFLGESIGWKKETGQAFGEDIDKIRTYSHEMIDKMGEIVWALNEKNDSLEDLLSYLRAYAVEYLTENNIESQVIMEETMPARFISGEMRRNIFLTLKEALHNIVKHAKATRVNLEFITKETLQIMISDNGIGFDPTQIRQFSNGLPNMRKRIEEIGGTMLLTRDDGTKIQISVPLT